MTPYKHALAAIAVVVTLVAAPASAIASPVTLTPGNSFVVQDPLGSGRQAEFAFLGGLGTLRFSNGGIGDNGLLANGNRPNVVGGLVGALNTGKVSLTAVDGAILGAGATTTSIAGQITTANGRKPRGLVNISADVTSLQVDSQTGVISLVGSRGGAQQDAPFIDVTLDGGRVVVNNLRFDLTNSLVIADMAATPLVSTLDPGSGAIISSALGATKNYTDVPLWTFSSITGPTVLPASGVLNAQDGDFSELASLGYRLYSPTTQGDVPSSSTP